MHSLIMLQRDNLICKKHLEIKLGKTGKGYISRHSTKTLITGLSHRDSEKPLRFHPLFLRASVGVAWSVCRGQRSGSSISPYLAFCLREGLFCDSHLPLYMLAMNCILLLPVPSHHRSPGATWDFRVLASKGQALYPLSNLTGSLLSWVSCVALASLELKDLPDWIIGAYYYLCWVFCFCFFKKTVSSVAQAGQGSAVLLPGISGLHLASM